MKNTGRIGRTFAAAGTIAALAAGGLLAAAPAIAAESPAPAAAVQGDRLIGYLGYFALSTNPGADWAGSPDWIAMDAAGSTRYQSTQVGFSGKTEAQIQTALTAEVTKFNTAQRLRWSIPAPGTTGQIKARTTDNAADSTICLVAPAATASATSWATCSAAANQKWSVESNKDVRTWNTFTINSVATGAGLNYNGEIFSKTNTLSRVFTMVDPVEQLVERDVVVTSPENEATVGSKGFDLSGTATPNAEVVVTYAAKARATGDPVGTTTADDKGAWKLENVKLPTGPAALTITAGAKSANLDLLVIDDTANIVLSTPKAGNTLVGSQVFFAGTAEPGAEVNILDADGKVVGTTTADSKTGAFSVEVVLPKGSTSASVVVGERTVTVQDLTVVADLKVTTPKADDKVGTNGTSFAGTGEPGATVNIQDTKGKVLASTIVGVDGDWKVTAKLTEDLKAVVVESAPQSKTISLKVVDDTAPLVIESPKAGDEVVGPDVTFTGTGQPGETVVITDADGNPLGETVVKDDGTWELVVTVPEGGSVVVEAGDQKVEIKDLEVVAELEILTPKAGDKIGTNGAEFTGKGQPGESVVIRDADGVEIGSTTVKPDGTWELNVVVPEGAAPIRVTAGNQTVVLEDVTVEDDTADLVVTSPAEGAQVPLSGFTITGTAQPLAEVEVREAGVARAAGDLLGTATANAQGVWTLDVQLPLGDAALAITAPGKTATLNVTVFDDTPEEVAPLVVTSPASGDTITDTDAIFEGTAAGGALVELKDADGVVLADTVANPDGSWSIAYALPAGKATYVIAAGGETVTLTDLVSVRNDGPVFEFAITSPAEGETVGTGDITFAGTGVPDSVIVIKDADGNPLGDTIVGTDGTWTLTIPAMPEGAQSIVVNDGTKDITFEFVVVEDEESTPLMDPLLGGSIAAGLLAFAGAFGLRRRFTATNA